MSAVKGKHTPAAQSGSTSDSDGGEFDPVSFQAELDASVNSSRTLVDSWLPHNLGAEWNNPHAAQRGDAAVQGLKDRARPPRYADPPRPILHGYRPDLAILTLHSSTDSDWARNPLRRTNSSQKTARSRTACSASTAPRSATRVLSSSLSTPRAREQAQQAEGAARTTRRTVGPELSARGRARQRPCREPAKTTRIRS